MKIRPVGAELFHTDGRTVMLDLIVTLRNFVNAPKNRKLYYLSQQIQHRAPCHTKYSKSLIKPLFTCFDQSWPSSRNGADAVLD
jgi:hypothetical protein